MAQTLIVLGTGNALATRCYNTCFEILTAHQLIRIFEPGSMKTKANCHPDKMGWVNFNNMIERRSVLWNSGLFTELIYLVVDIIVKDGKKSLYKVFLS